MIRVKHGIEMVTFHCYGTVILFILLKFHFKATSDSVMDMDDSYALMTQVRYPFCPFFCFFYYEVSYNFSQCKLS